MKVFHIALLLFIGLLTQVSAQTTNQVRVYRDIEVGNTQTVFPFSTESRKPLSFLIATDVDVTSMILHGPDGTVLNTLDNNGIVLMPADETLGLSNRYIFKELSYPSKGYYWIEMNYVEADESSVAMMIVQQENQPSLYDYSMHIAPGRWARVGELDYPIELSLSNYYGEKLFENEVHRVTITNTTTGKSETITVDASSLKTDTFRGKRDFYSFHYPFPEPGEYIFSSHVTFTDKEGEQIELALQYVRPIKVVPQAGEYVSSRYAFRYGENGCIEGLDVTVRYRVLEGIKANDAVWVGGQSSFIRSPTGSTTVNRPDVSGYYERGYRQTVGEHEYTESYTDRKLYNLGDGPWDIGARVISIPGALNSVPIYYDNDKALTITDVKQSDLCYQRTTNNWDHGGIDNIKEVNEAGDEVIAVILERDIYTDTPGEYRFTFSVYDGSIPEKKVGDYEFTQTLEFGKNLMRLRIPKSEWPEDMKLSLFLRDFKMHYPGGGYDGAYVIRPQTRPQVRQVGTGN